MPWKLNDLPPRSEEDTTALGDAGGESRSLRKPVMRDENRIRELLEKILDSGCTPEEACAEIPELLPEVREHLKRLRSVEDQLDKLFPLSGPPGASTTPSAADYNVDPARSPDNRSLGEKTPDGRCSYNGGDTAVPG